MKKRGFERPEMMPANPKTTCISSAVPFNEPGIILLGHSPADWHSVVLLPSTVEKKLKHNAGRHFSLAERPSIKEAYLC
jgi:hypothetical protein